MATKGLATQWAILLIVVIIAAAMLWGLWPKDKNFEEATGLNEFELWDNIKSKVDKESSRLEKTALTELEQAQIEAWIIENDLNRYGDSKDTVYIGGTPLFDEATGKSTDRFDYIINKYPDKPWRN